jgi:uncharacterized protein YebE (UPF0316 family)
MLDIPIWQLAILIFCLEVFNVALSTVRMLYMVDKSALVTSALSFVEVNIWIFVVANVVNRVKESYILGVIFAGGFAVGNSLGIAIKKRIERKG